MEHEFLIAWVKAVFTTIGIGALLTACLAFKQKTRRDTIVSENTEEQIRKYIKNQKK